MAIPQEILGQMDVPEVGKIMYYAPEGRENYVCKVKVLSVGDLGCSIELATPDCCVKEDIWHSELHDYPFDIGISPRRNEIYVRALTNDDIMSNGKTILTINDEESMPLIVLYQSFGMRALYEKIKEDYMEYVEDAVEIEG